MWRAIFLATAIVATPTLAAGEFMTGNSLFEACSGSGGAADLSYCLGYVAGVADVMLTDSVDRRRACIPSNVTGGLVKDVVVQYLSRNPAERLNSADSLVASALQQSFPCQ